MQLLQASLQLRRSWSQQGMGTVLRNREENMHNDCVHIYKSGKEEMSRSSQPHRFLLFASSESKAKTTMATGKTSRERSKAGVVLLQM
jgi:hypothetical protein